MSMPTLPQALYKANLDLWLRIGELLEDHRTQWTALMVRELEDGATDANVDLKALQRGDWQSLALLPAQALQRLASHGLGDMQASAQTALGSQMNFATGFQAALADWQQATAAALGDAGAQNVHGDLRSMFEQALQTLGTQAGAFAGEATETRRDAPRPRAANSDAPKPAGARKAAATPRAGKSAGTAKTAPKPRAAKKNAGSIDSGKQAARKVAKRAAPRKATKAARATKAAKAPAKRRRNR